MKISVMEAVNKPEVTAITDIDIDILTKKVWSPIVFKNYANQTNFIQCNYAVIDIDEILTIETALEILHNEDLAYFLGTTRHHQKEKSTGDGNGNIKPPCDRFRVIIPLDSPVTNIDQYNLMQQQISMIFPWADRAGQSPAQRFFPFTNEVLYDELDSGNTLPVDLSKGLLSKSTFKDFMMDKHTNGERHDALVKACCDFIAQGYSKEDFIKVCSKLDSAYTDKQSLNTIEGLYNKQHDEILTPKRELTPKNKSLSIPELSFLFNKENLEIWFDEFHNKIFSTLFSPLPSPWTDVHNLKMIEIIESKTKFRNISTSKMDDSIKLYAHQNTRNEPKDWIQSLVWDKIPRVEFLFINGFGTQENDYYKTAANNWLVSMVARIMVPGCKVDNMIILEGAQGAFKSSALGALGGAWFAECHEKLDSKDFKEFIQGKLLIEIAELDSMNRAEANTIKKVITCQVDRFRPSYGKNSQDFPRQCVFVGTTNDNDYLKDVTGGRRFWPVEVGSIDLDYIKDNRDQLFAEATALYKAGISWWEMPVSDTLDMQESRRQVDEWEDIIENYVTGRKVTKIKQVAFECFGLEGGSIDRLTQLRISKSLRVLNWAPNQDSKNGRHWAPKQ